MNIRKVLSNLQEIANELDLHGMFKQADKLDETMTKLAQSGYVNLRELHPHLQNRILEDTAHASELSLHQNTNRYNFENEKTDRNPGWDYINNLQKKLPYRYKDEEYKKLRQYWSQLAASNLFQKPKPQGDAGRPQGIQNVTSSETFKNEAFKLAEEVFQSSSEGNLWRDYLNKLNSSPIFKNKPEAQKLAREKFWYLFQKHQAKKAKERKKLQ